MVIPYKAKKTIFISKRAQREMTATMDFPNTLLTNAIDLDDYPVGRRRAGRITRFLFLGRLEKVKGISQLLEAFSMLAEKHPEARLTIAGDGAMRDEVEAFIKNRDQNIEFLGWVGSRDVPGLLSEHDVFMLPSWEKGQPVALLEAMAAGKVIITSLDYIEDMITGIRVRPGDVKDLYEKMLDVYNKPESSRRIGDAARSRAQAMGWNLVIKSFLNEYKISD